MMHIALPNSCQECGGKRFAAYCATCGNDVPPRRGVKPTGTPIILCVDNRLVASETADRAAPIAIRYRGRDDADVLCREANLVDRATGKVMGKIGYWPEQPITMEARNGRERTRGVTIWLELDAATVDVVPVELKGGSGP